MFFGLCLLFFNISFEAGIVASALLLEVFSRIYSKNRSGIW
jgi:hypothetical protein